ncbi:FAD/NAD(P)-binding protein [Actinomadura opuntiae]|uniref:FAD/NAD(P)-binding protein n=1 Tax=Actinomadura sp. OS1-43 TaxID=604315 RepID=UPI00255B0339|nr:FAD/NAD(P)-binding protein [Actinomadura sp. OS1-43]MDL4814193.1 FAD/NAD(P)-binding protein [Actinomadura sp. OS1-43]
MTLPHRVDRSEGKPLVAVVGGGASATLLAAHLLRRAGAVPRLLLIDRDGLHGRGQAYSTQDSNHLLNARAANMSGVQDDPGHLLDWTCSQGIEASGEDFLPRPLYGRYLRNLLDASARARPGHLTELTGTVLALEAEPLTGGWKLHLADGTSHLADAVVLAVGNQAPSRLLWQPPAHRYIADPWRRGALDVIDDDAPVLIVGTGLTMVDLAISLTGQDPDRVVHAVSRHGLLPRPHHPPPRPPEAGIVLPAEPMSLRELLRWSRLAVRGNGGEWHGFVDAVRPHVPALWGRLSEADRRRFLDLVARHWEVHRHRIPPASAARIDALRAAGRLRVLRGRIDEVRTDAEHRLAVRIASDGEAAEVNVGWLVNGTGPAAGPATDTFLSGLVSAGIARPGPLGLGLDADAGGAVRDAAGRPHPNVFTLGPPLRGVRYETTAIPEIRAQAAVLADRLALLGRSAHRASSRENQAIPT